MPRGYKAPQDHAEEIMDEADSDYSTENLTRGTEVYEEDEESDDEDGPEELDLEPRGGRSSSFGDFDDGYGEDDY